MKHLFSEWETFAAGVRAAPHIIVLSDYDGTLTPIVSRPEQASLSPEAREVLAALAQKHTFSVGIISGRALAEVRDMVAVEEIYYAGNHGLELEGPGLSFIHPAAESSRTEMKALTRKLTARLAGIKGVIVEDKGFSVSVHYRMVAPNNVAKVAVVFQEVTAPALSHGRIRVTPGKKVWEVRPPTDWHKGKAVETIVEKLKTALSLQAPLTVYLGDDFTDEDAFKVVRPPHGWSILVGQSSPSSAEYFLNDSSEVIKFLSRLLKLN